MFKIELYYNLNKENTTLPNPRSQFPANHEKIKRFFLPDDGESKDIEESDGAEDNDTKTG